MYWKQDFLDGKVQLKIENHKDWDRIMEILCSWKIYTFGSHNGTHNYVKIWSDNALERRKGPFCDMKIIEPKFIQNIE